MSSAKEHGETLLAAIIPGRRDLLEKALKHLSTEHFVDRTHANLFTMLTRYFDVTGSILTRPALMDLLEHARADAGTKLSYGETYDLLAAMPADEAMFAWSLTQVRELAAERATSSALTGAMEILTRGVTGDKGQVLQGHAEARSYLSEQFAAIERDLTAQEAPEGDMRGEGEEILAEYAATEQARAAGRSLGVRFGVPPIDERLDGLHRGEFALIVGYSSDGKTSLCVQLAWSAVVEQGKNVVLLTTETVRPQIRRRVIARHSCLPDFGLDSGINALDIKRGTLRPAERQRLPDVVRDFDANPGYGHLYLVQVPRAANMTYIENKLTAIERMWPVDLVIMDYLALLVSERRRGTDREELSGILKAAKQISTTHADGAGVPFVSPWQVRREARMEAERLGYYTSNATSETSEATNSPDLLISLLAPMDNDKRICGVRSQFLKGRDMGRANSIELHVDYATSRFFSRLPEQNTVDGMFL